MIKSRSTVLLKRLLEHPVLIQLRNGPVSKEQFLFYVTQKSYLTTNIPRFIFTCIQKLEPVQNKALIKVLIENYKDELGIDENGIARVQKAHVTWKNYFHKTLGLTCDQLDSCHAIEAARVHSERFLSYEKEASPLAMVGCFLMLERLVPLEYRAIQSARNHHFPDRFLAAEGDSERLLDRKDRAREYIDNHIAHDANFHFPLLLDALSSYTDCPQQFAEIEVGLEALVKMKLDFYDGILASWASLGCAA
jgi:pyrroloquinoline quinone (PQQ) biosynthesis protein C